MKKYYILNKLAYRKIADKNEAKPGFRRWLNMIKIKVDELSTKWIFSLASPRLRLFINVN